MHLSHAIDNYFWGSAFEPLSNTGYDDLLFERMYLLFTFCLYVRLIKIDSISFWSSTLKFLPFYSFSHENFSLSWSHKRNSVAKIKTLFLWYINVHLFKAMFINKTCLLDKLFFVEISMKSLHFVPKSRLEAMELLKYIRLTKKIARNWTLKKEGSLRARIHCVWHVL